MDRDHWKWLFEELSRIEVADCVHRCQCMCHRSSSKSQRQVTIACTEDECIDCGVCGIVHSRVALNDLRNHLKKCHGIEPAIKK